MKIEEYRSLVKEKLLERLEPIGFKAHGDHFFINQNEACLALLRVKDKWSNLTQQAKYLAVVRHNFLPDLDGRDVQGFVEDPALYPFKINPLKLSKLKVGIFRKSISYHYHSCNLGHYDTVDIDYGEVNPSATLEKIYDQISSHGIDWLNSLTPDEAARQVTENGNQDYIEKIWIESYAKHGY